MNIILIVLILANLALGFTIAKIIEYSDKKMKGLDKYQEYFMLMNQWMKLKENNMNISDYLVAKGYTDVAIYGMGVIGFRLCDELLKRNGGVCIKRTIDQAANTIYHPLGVWNPGDGFKDLDVDAIIVTVNTVDYNTIRSYMNNKEIPLLKIDDIIYSI